MYEPGPNSFNSAYIASVVQRLHSLQQQGVEVVLDLGLQYPPSWVFNLPGETRFVNQYDDIWHGDSSTDVPNAVFNSYVRAAEATYIQHISTDLGASSFAAVRVGGLLTGELRYPPASYNGHTNSIWDYDSAAQAGAPVKAWSPGAGSPADAKSALAYYFQSLTDYETWQLNQLQRAFPSSNMLLMMPGWGLRPTAVDSAIADGFQNRTPAETGGMISSGLDWDSEAKALAVATTNGTLYTTWLDAPSYGSDPVNEAPVEYLSSLARQYNLPLAGENTGGGGAAALMLSLSRVRTFHLTGMYFMSAASLLTNQAGLSLSSFQSIILASG